MRKKSVFILLIILFSISFALAQNTSNNNSVPAPPPSDTSIVNKAYQCLQSQVDSKDTNSISLQEAIFGILALGSNSKLISVIDGKIVSGNHWQESNPLKDTSQVMLAYNKIGKSHQSPFKKGDWWDLTGKSLHLLYALDSSFAPSVKAE